MGNYTRIFKIRSRAVYTRVTQFHYCVAVVPRIECENPLDKL